MGFVSEIKSNELEICSHDFLKMLDIFLNCLKRLSKKKDKYEDVVIFGKI